MAVTVRTLDNFVGGAWVHATGDVVREIVSPVTGETIAEAPDASSADIDRAVAAARAAQPKWAAVSAWERAAVCHAIAELIVERREEFAHALSLEQGKPYAAEALPDIDESAENFRIAAEDVKRLETAVIPSRDPNKRILTFRKPNGVYACITPWNFPTLIPVELIAPGIAAGNTIVMKPSEWTPIAMANFMQIMADAGLPDGVVNVVFGGGEVGELLVTHPGVDCIGFVGSHGTAEKIVRAAGLKRSLIEASGNGPVIVCEDADLARAAQGVRSQMRFATQRTSSATTARCRPALDKRCTRPLAERSSSVSGGSSERSPAPSAATSPARPGVVHTSAQRRTKRARRSATSCQARGAGESSSRPSPEPW